MYNVPFGYFASQNFGNILSAIDGYASFLVDSLIPETRAHRHAQRIVDATRHASELTRRLMHVAKASTSATVSVEPVALGDVVRRTLELMDHVLVPRNVEAVVHTAALPYVEADADQFFRMVLQERAPSGRGRPIRAVDVFPDGRARDYVPEQLQNS